MKQYAGFATLYGCVKFDETIMTYGGCTYIITNRHHTVLYTGMTSNLVSRTMQHQEKFYPQSFTARYNCNKLVYYRYFPRIEEAIDFEKKIKAGSRAKKLALINSMNPGWKNLWDEISQW